MDPVKAQLGNTIYELEEQPGLNMRITRTNAEGVTLFHFPKALIDKCVEQLLETAIKDAVRKLVRK